MESCLEEFCRTAGPSSNTKHLGCLSCIANRVPIVEMLRSVVSCPEWCVVSVVWSGRKSCVWLVVCSDQRHFCIQTVTMAFPRSLLEGVTEFF